MLADDRPVTPLCIPRAGGEETQLFIKEVQVEGRRYIVCRNEAEAKKDAADRAAIMRPRSAAEAGRQGVDRELRLPPVLRAPRRRRLRSLGKVAEEARYDGMFVLRTNAGISPCRRSCGIAT